MTRLHQLVGKRIAWDRRINRSMYEQERHQKNYFTKLEHSLNHLHSRLWRPYSTFKYTIGDGLE